MGVYYIGLAAILLLVILFTFCNKKKKPEEKWEIIPPETPPKLSPIKHIDVLLGIYEYAVISGNEPLKEHVKNDIKELTT